MFKELCSCADVFKLRDYNDHGDKEERDDEAQTEGKEREREREREKTLHLRCGGCIQ